VKIEPLEGFPGLSAQVLDERGNAFGWAAFARTWLFQDRLRARLRIEGSDPDWPFEAILNSFPAHLREVLESAARRNLEHARKTPRDMERLEFQSPSMSRSAPRRLLRMLASRAQWQVERLLSDPFRSGRVRTEPMIPMPGILRADPFSLRVQDRDWLLFEEQLAGDRGRLRSALQTEKGWEVQAGEALSLPHHLSWPCVFEMDGRIFMLPESGEAGEVALWECEEFPSRWRKVKVLLSGRPWHDPCLVELGGYWWLFVSAGGGSPRDHSSELDLFYSPDPIRVGFKAHALNPVSVSVAGSRPAGNPFLRDGELIRPAQDCRGGYGSAILLQRVDRLTTEEYSTTTLGRLDPPVGAHGLHTLNPLPDGGWVVDVLRP
jgi:hypothetical protein